ncbi:adenylyl-sulfate kinase [Bacteroidota bacterium]
MYKESKRRSILKTISWRFWATLTTAILVYIFTGKIEIAIAIGGIEIIIKIILYFIHERAWNNVNYGKKGLKPAVIWLTGLSGAGKSTIAQGVCTELKNKGLKVEHLDGDIVRDIFPKTGFSKEERDRHIRRIGFLASMLEKNGVFVVASFIAPYKESRNFVRNLCDNYKEIYLSTPLEECEKRDPKGLYAKVRAGEIKNFTGIDDPYEKPESPYLTLDTSRFSIQESIDQVIKSLRI